MAVKIGIIGGSGLERPDLLKERQEKFVETPYGRPSDALIIGRIGKIDVVILSRHGRQHTISPTNINYRANLFALKMEGCTHIIATTACGSLQEEVHPGDFMTPDQFIDRTRSRELTFFDGSNITGRLSGVCHLPMADPFCKSLREILFETAGELSYTCHPKGTVVCIEGPRFSTRAESLLFKSWNAHLVNMTVVPEAPLAQELALPYASLAIATDYDCWRNCAESVDVGAVMDELKKTAERACNVLKAALPKIVAFDWTDVHSKLKRQLEVAVMHTDTGK